MIIQHFQLLFSCVRDKGIYVIEDTCTSYWYRYGGTCDPLAPGSTINYLKSLLDQQNWAEVQSPNPFYEPKGPLAETLAELHFYHNMAILVKGNNRHQSSGDERQGDKICVKPQ